MRFSQQRHSVYYDNVLDSSAQLAVDSSDLRKRYGDFAALDGFDLRVQAGGIFGLLGANGAGKTTFIRTLLGYIRPTSGHVSVFGHDCERESLVVRSICGYLPAEAKLFRTMRGSAVLEFYAELHPRGDLTKAREIADRLELETRRFVGFMSTGMRQKLAIACTLSIQSRLMILDEPTANLDPQVRRIVLDLIRERRDQGATVVLSSHLMDEIEELCTAAAIVASGRVRQVIDLDEQRAVYLLSATTAGSGQSHDPNDLMSNQTVRPAGIRPLAADASRSHRSTATSWLVDTRECSFEQAVDWVKDLGGRVINIEPYGLRPIYEACSAS